MLMQHSKHAQADPTAFLHFLTRPKSEAPQPDDSIPPELEKAWQQRFAAREASLLNTNNLP
jgi:hypothetical protein